MPCRFNKKTIGTKNSITAKNHGNKKTAQNKWCKKSGQEKGFGLICLPVSRHR